MAKQAGEKVNQSIKLELDDKQATETVQNIVDGYRKLGYPEETIEKIRADLLSDFQKEARLEDEKEEYAEKVLENLKQKVEVEENVEYMGYKGKKVRINLPKIEGKFEGFTFEYFFSNESVSKKDFENSPELERKSYSMKDIGKLLEAMAGYMQAVGVKNHGYLYYNNWITGKVEKYSNFRGDAGFRSDAGGWLKCLACYLHDWCRLKDKDVYGIKDSRVSWGDDSVYPDFLRYNLVRDTAHLFLKLS